ncbi:MAG TPA: BatA domain-containing protein [Vicinamibacterales bacterium]
MNFLAPLFFAALAGLAIPVLIHLIQREKKQIQQFPSLMFLRQIPYKSIQRRRIHNWLLLIVRMTALALIIAAFARPFFEGADPLAGTQGAREVVILLDQSYSIGYSDRWERARAAANAAVNGLGPNDRGSLVLFSTGAEIVLRNSVDKAPLTSAIGAARTGAGATRYAPALKVAGSLLAESGLPRREVVLISDFQRNGWRGEEGSRLPPGTVLTPVPITGPLDQPNVSVTAVSLARSMFSNQERVAVTAAVVNRSTRSANGGTLTLEVGGRGIQSKTLDVDGDGTASVTFDPFTVTARNMRGTVRIGSDGLAADNAFHFIVSPAEPVRIILVDRGSASAGLFLNRALAIGDAPRFETAARQPDAVTEDDLRRASVVVMNDVTVPAAFGRRLARFVENGGGLLVALGPRATWPQDADVLPAALLQPVDRTRGDSARIGALEFGHPVFEPFRAPRSGDFAPTRFYGYRAVKPVEGAQVLARFDAGAPALLERRVGNGRVLLWTSTLDLSWSDLPLKPIYLPFVHQAVRHLAAYAQPAPWLTVGQVLDPTAGVVRGATPAGRVAVTPSGRRVPLDEEGSEVLSLSESGFYAVRGESSDTELAVVASNVDPAESDLTSMDPKEIVAATLGAPTGAQGGGGLPMTPEAQEGSQRLWWYLLVAGILLLAADTLLSNRLSKS